MTPIFVLVFGLFNRVMLQNLNTDLNGLHKGDLDANCKYMHFSHACDAIWSCFRSRFDGFARDVFLRFSHLLLRENYFLLLLHITS